MVAARAAGPARPVADHLAEPAARRAPPRAAPGRPFSPNEKYAALTETAGYVPLSLSPDDDMELLPAAWRAVNAYGIKISRRIYDGKELNPLRMQHSGVTARKGLHEVHYDPYDISRVWVRDYWDGGWITVFWTQLHRVAAPFGELAGTTFRKSLPGATEAELADAVEDLLTRAGHGPGDGGGPARRPAGGAAGSRPGPGPSGPPPWKNRSRWRSPQPGNPATSLPGLSSRCRSSTRSARRRNGDRAAVRGRLGPADHAARLAAVRRGRAVDPAAASPAGLALTRGRQARRARRGAAGEPLPAGRGPDPGHRADRQAGRDSIRMNRLAHYGRSGLMVSGPARTGKTTAVTQLGKTAEVMHRQRNLGSRDDIPVIYITVPPAATGKMIAMEVARFLGLPVPRRANITDVIEFVCGICLDIRVTMIIVDELHNLDMSTRAGAEASDTLKYFSERLPATFVYSGIGLDRGALLAACGATRSPAGSPSSRPARSPPGRNGPPLSPRSRESCGSTGTRTAPSSRLRTTCTAAPAA